MKHINDMTMEDWEQLYVKEGKSITDLSKLFDVSLRTIHLRLKNVGIKARKPGHPTSLNIDEKELIRLYVDEGKSAAAISRIFGCSDRTIRVKVEKLGIKRKTKVSVLTKPLLKYLYEDKKKSAREISDELGVDPAQVYGRLHKYGFKVDKGSKPTAMTEEQITKAVEMYKSGKPARTISNELGISDYQIVVRELQKKQIEIKKPTSYTRKLPDNKEIARLYVEEGLSIGQISDKLNSNKASILEKLKQAGVKRRSRSEASSGSRNHMYNKRHTTEDRTSMSQAYSKGIREINPNFGFGNSEVVDTPLQGGVTVRSSWEAAVARYLNNYGFTYLYEPDVISLETECGSISYLPDFLIKAGPLVSDEFYIEVKGLWKDGAKEKVALAIKAGFRITVWEGKDLQKLGILDRSFRPMV